LSQALLAERHTVLEGLNSLGGQLFEVPLQTSFTSHGPSESRHTVPAGFFASVGHWPLVPVHFSATSHTPSASRQVVPDALKVSAGHCALLPVHFSATSQAPLAARHTVVAGLKSLPGQRKEAASQASATSQGPADARHWTPFCAMTALGQVVLAPSQVSATSHAPAASRHTVPLAAGEPVHTPAWQVPVPTQRDLSLHAVPLALPWQGEGIQQTRSCGFLVLSLEPTEKRKPVVGVPDAWIKNPADALEAIIAWVTSKRITSLPRMGTTRIFSPTLSVPTP
jgi:hypothetical protein